MRLDGRFRDVEISGRLRDAAEFDDGEQHAGFSRGELEDLLDDVGRGCAVERGLADEQDRRGVVGDAGLAAAAGGEWQQMADEALAVMRDERQRDALAPR